MAEPSVLLVDEDPRRRRALEVGLRRVGFRVTVAGSAEQALWFLDHALPEVIVSTSHFSQGMSSLSLAEMIRVREEWSSIVLVMIRDPNGGYDALALADDVVGERVTIASLALRTRQAIFQRKVDGLFTADEGGLRRLKGSFAEITAIDLLGLIERLGSSGTLGVETPSGPATLWFTDGRVIDAALGRFEGEEAVFRLLMADEGSFELTLTASLHAERIEVPMERLIGDSLRQLDEWMRLCGDVPPLESCLRLDPESLELRREELAEELSALIRSCDGRRTIREVVDNSELGPLLALEAIQNLRSVGILVEGASEEAAAEAEERGSSGLGLKELPPLPAFPEPFPGLGMELSVEQDTPLVSGIPEEISTDMSRETETPAEDPKPRPETGGKLRSLAGPTVAAAAEYVFRPPDTGGSRRDARRASSSAIERAIDDAISGLESSGGARDDQALPVRRPAAANGRPGSTGGDGDVGPRSATARSAGAEALGDGDDASAASRTPGAEERSTPPQGKPKAASNRLGRVVSLVRIREPRVESPPRPALDRAAFTAVAGTAAGELLVVKEPSLVECEEALAEALRTPSVLINIAEADEADEDGGAGEQAGDRELDGSIGDDAEDDRAAELPLSDADRDLLAGAGRHEQAETPRGALDETGLGVGAVESLGSAARASAGEGKRGEQAGAGAGAGLEKHEEVVLASGGPRGSSEDETDAELGSEGEEEVAGASISSTRRSLPETPSGIVAGELFVGAGAADSLAAVALLPESPSDLERLGELARRPPAPRRAPPAPSAASSSVILSPSLSASAIVRPPASSSSLSSSSSSSSSAAYSGAFYPGVGLSRAAQSAAAQSMAARSMAARSMSGASAAHLLGESASTVSRLEPAPGYDDDEPIEFGRSSRGWWWVFFIGAASLALWAWLHYGSASGSAGPPAADRGERSGAAGAAPGEPGGSEEALWGEAETPGSSSGGGLPADAEADEDPAEEPLSAEESAALDKELEEGERLLRKGSEKEASMVVARVLARAPRHGGALLLRAKISLDRGELKAALDSAERAAEADPEMAEAYLTIGVVHEERADIADAIAAYERYLELAPDARYASGIRRQVASLRRRMP